MSTRFSYAGPATIEGVTYDRVLLMEDPSDGGLRSWAGSVSFSQEEAPQGFTPNLGSDFAETIELPDGRTAQLLVTSINFDGRHWTLDLQGTGPTPA